MKKTIALLSMSLMLVAFSTEIEAKSFKRSQFTKAQQEAFYKKALAACRKAHGDRLHRVEMMYSKAQFRCWIY